MSDILESQRRKRNRPPKLDRTRDVSLVNVDEQSVESSPDEISHEKKITEIASDNAAKKKTEAISNNTVDELVKELENLPEVAKRRIVRIEKELDRKLGEFISENENLTLEVMLEAVFLEIESSEHLKTRVLKEAEKRYWQRKRAGQIKRILKQVT